MKRPGGGPAPAASGEPGGIVHRAVPPRVLLCERDAGGAAIFAALQALGIEAIRCRDPRALLEEVVRRAPDVVICDHAVGTGEDLRMLELLRRAAPAAPIILIASEGSLVTQRLVQGLRPVYYMVGPVDVPELREVVEAALARRVRASG